MCFNHVVQFSVNVFAARGESQGYKLGVFLRYFGGRGCSIFGFSVIHMSRRGFDQWFGGLSRSREPGGLSKARFLCMRAWKGIQIIGKTRVINEIGATKTYFLA